MRGDWCRCRWLRYKIFGWRVVFWGDLVPGGLWWLGRVANRIGSTFESCWARISHLTLRVYLIIKLKFSNVMLWYAKKLKKRLEFLSRPIVCYSLIAELRIENIKISSCAFECAQSSLILCSIVFALLSINSRGCIFFLRKNINTTFKYSR